MMADKVLGTCLLMCPEEEIEMREREGLVHVCERSRGVADRRRMVKTFTRSAAGREMCRPDQLRPPPILKKTVNYLIGSVVPSRDVAWSAVYAFVTDRLRAVRQDLVIQQPPPAVCAAILEPIVRFHAYAAYRLCEEPVDVFDPHLNQTHLNETVKQLLVCYDWCESDTSDTGLSAEREQMEALYGLMHIGNVDALYRMITVRHTHADSDKGILDTALRLSVAYFHNDYVNVCQLFHSLPLLLACIIAICLPRIRRLALQTMNTAYSSKNLRYPVDHLTNLLIYHDSDEATRDCQHYGIHVDHQGVHFLKSSFQSSVKESSPKRVHFIEKLLSDIDLPELLLTATTTEPER